MVNNLKIEKVGLLYSCLVVDDDGNESTIYARNKRDLTEYYKYFKQ